MQRRSRRFAFLACVGLLLPQWIIAAEVTSGPLTLIVSNGSVKTVTWPRLLIPALQTNRLATGSDVGALTEVPRSSIAATAQGYSHTVSNTLSGQFFSLTLGQMSSNALLTANVLNRLAYGPTPDELQRVFLMGPQTYIDEQLQPETLSSPIDNYTVHVTNGVGGASVPNTNWTTVSVTGVVTASTLYIYMPGTGSAYVDDVSLSVIYTNFVVTTNTGGALVTNASPYLGANVLVNGGFEAGYTGWTEAGSFFTGSDVVSTPVNSGSGSLRIVSTYVPGPNAPALGNGNSITQSGIPGLTNGHRCVLSFSYLPRPNSANARINIRLSGGGVMVSDGGEPSPLVWAYATATGRATGTPTLYFYLDGAGDTYLDDIKLVPGTVPEIGPNLIRNGNFESPLTTTDWQRTTDFTNSAISNLRSRSGSGSLRLIATAAGGGNNDSVFQANIAGVTNGQIYTLSFWYTLPTRNRILTSRLSGSATPGLLRVDIPGSSPTTAKYLLDSIGTISSESGFVNMFTLGGGRLADLRAWFIGNAVGSPRQLLEVLSQFLENHFVTEHAKSFDYFDRYYDDGTVQEILATDWEYREVTQWRDALLNPNCTFYDLLKIHAESPAQIVYLDTVESRGDGNRIANENYARELFELYCMGVDNGYDQLDITAMSRAWTGWSVDIVDRQNWNNPFALRSSTYGFYPTGSGSGVSNLVGVWAFNYKTNFHGTNRAPILSEWHTNANRTNLMAVGPKRYPARLGPPWAGRPYQITLPRRTNFQTNSIQDGYDVIRSLATNLFTAEYISVKLCRLFVHDEFPNPTTTTNLPEYGFYDYTNPDRSAEAELVRQCMATWDTPGPDGRRGNIRAVLRTIFESELFRAHGGSLQKVKTPLEFTVSAMRALRSQNTDGSFTANTDGYSIGGRSRTSSSGPLVRMGNMRLFDRDAPDGYPEAAAPWVSAGTLAERIRFVQTALMAQTDTNKNDGISGGNFNLTDPVSLLMKQFPGAGNPALRDAGMVVDYFLGILFPGEGAANLDLYRANAVSFLNSLDNGSASSPFQSLAPSSAAGSAYDTRVRAMVSMLMTLQRFQEQ